MKSILYATEPLKEAIVLGVNWKISDYDPEGLESAIKTIQRFTIPLDQKGTSI